MLKDVNRPIDSAGHRGYNENETDRPRKAVSVSVNGIHMDGAAPARSVFVGIDGGGTKTSLCAFVRDAEGKLKLTASSVSEGINYNTVGVPCAVSRVLAGMEALGLPPGALAAVGIGDPSCDVEAVSRSGQAFLSALTEALGVPVILKSDAYMTLYALTGGVCPGVLTISGTGAIAIGEDASHRISVAGGWGQLTGDEGSGHYVGLSGIKAALRAFDGIAPATALLPALCRVCGVSDPRALIHVFYDPDRPFAASDFATVVAACAEEGDAVSLEILRRAAAFLADYTAALLDRTQAALVGAYGSVLTRNGIVRAEFERILKERYPGVTVREPSLSPEEAAARLAADTYPPHLS